MKIKGLVLIVSFCTIILNTCCYANSSIDRNYLNNVVNLINTRYDGELNEDYLYENILYSIFSGLDPYSEFYTSEELEKFESELNYKYEGIGVEVERFGKKIIVTEVFHNSPAEKSGIIYGDEIVNLNGNEIYDISTENIINIIKGDKGTNIKITINRDGNLFNLDLIRNEIELNPVEYKYIDNTGYLKLNLFSSRSASFVEKVLDEFKTKNIEKVIFDLRDNPGGDLYEALKISDFFVNENKLLTKVNFKSDEYEDEEIYSKSDKYNFNVVVLVNENSASASEIVSAAIQDNKVGKLVGKKTYGKATIQNIFPILNKEAYTQMNKEGEKNILDGYNLSEEYKMNLSNKDILGWIKLTIGQYETPGNKVIHKIGIEPDYSIDNNEMKVDLKQIKRLRKINKPNLNYTGIDVYNCELILKILNYEINTPDLIFDEGTFNAVKKFQLDNNLYGYGVLDFTTQEKLNQKLDSISKLYDIQLSKAIDIIKE